MSKLFDYQKVGAELYGVSKALTQRNPLDILKVYLSGRADRQFDRRHGIETVVPDLLTTHDRIGENLNAATLYRGVRAGPFAEFMKRISLDRDLGFVDYGCGKGRAMILAAEYGFRKVKGLEFSQQLAEQARRNIAAVQSKFKTSFSVVHTDVVEYAPTADDSVFFFYDPFDASILARCFENIDKSYENDPRQQYAIYHNNLVLDMSSLIDLKGWPVYESFTIQGNLFFLLSRPTR